MKRVSIDVFGDIGDPGFSPAKLRKAIGSHRGPLDVFINSPGGSAYDGVAIANMLRQHPGEVHCHVLGVAASAASVIAAAGNRVSIADSGSIMVHSASASWGGNAEELDKTADQLRRVDRQIAGVYAAKARGSAEDWLARMRAETWYDASEAVAVGLADDIEQSSRVAARIDPATLARYHNVPARLKPAAKVTGKRAEPKPKRRPATAPTDESVRRVLRDRGYDVQPADDGPTTAEAGYVTDTSIRRSLRNLGYTAGV